MLVEPKVQGVVLGGRYRLQSYLGRGGMGTVWSAEHLELGTLVAIKLISENVDDPATLARFRREAKSAARLRSPHVVQVLDYGVDDQTPYIVMELLEGESLAQRLKRDQRLDLETTAVIVVQVARALERAHSLGIVHRDLKPDNIFLDPGGGLFAKVLDFGIAKDLYGGEASGAPTRSGALLGTPSYMSPEQIRGGKYVDHRTDIWALGVLTYECVTGIRPFAGDNVLSLATAICSDEPRRASSLAPVAESFDAWFARATAKQPEARFQSARECAIELATLTGLTTAQRQGLDSDMVRFSSAPAEARSTDRPRLEGATATTMTELAPPPPLAITQAPPLALSGVRRLGRSRVAVASLLALCAVAALVLLVFAARREPRDTRVDVMRDQEQPLQRAVPPSTHVAAARTPASATPQPSPSHAPSALAPRESIHEAAPRSIAARPRAPTRPPTVAPAPPSPPRPVTSAAPPASDQADHRLGF